MKKVILSFLFLFSLISAGQAISPAHMVSKSVESKNLGSPQDTVPVFKLGNVSFISDNSGSAEYKNGWIRNTIQWCLYRSYNNGPLLVKADEGYWIKDVTFTYVEQADGMLADKPGESQASIAAYASGKAIEVNGTEKQFYVGKKTTGNGGYLTITKFAVTYYKRPTAIALEDMTLAVGDAFQLTPTVQPADADTMYAWSSDNSAVVSIDKDGVIAAKAVGEAHITVSAGSLSATCKMTVEADSSISLTETFSNCSVEKNREGNTKVKGDQGMYNWVLHFYQRQLSGGDDKMNSKADGVQGVRVLYDGYIAMDGVQEGGVKAIAFDWRTTSSTNIVNHGLHVGDQTYEYNTDVVKSTTVFHFARRFEVKENTQFSFDMASKIGSKGQSYILVGPITITPYLLFNLPNHRDTISVDEAGSYDLNQALINNTGEKPVFAVISNTTDAATSINEGILSIDNMTQRGEIVVEASWNSGKVTTTLTLSVEYKPVIRFEQDTVIVNLLDAPFTNALMAPAGIGAVTYTSSDVAVAMVTDDGVVTPLGPGEAVITAHIAASQAYGPSEASYRVIVNYNPSLGETWTETFSGCYAEKVFDGRIHVAGDEGIYDWSVARFQRVASEDMVGEELGIRVRYNGSIATAGEQEGGVKELSFDWRATGKDMPIHFYVQVGQKEYEYTSSGMSTLSEMHYVRPIGVASNTTIRLSVPGEEKTAQSYVIFGPLTITPYLLFTVPNRLDTIVVADTTLYDLHESLIDNTDAEGMITYEMVHDETGVAVLEGSVINVGAATKNGIIDVKATWGEVTTTMSLFVEAETPSGLKTPSLSGEGRGEATKQLVNGQLRIYRDGKGYSVLGNSIY